MFYKHNQGLAANEKAAYQRVFQEFAQLNQKHKAEGKPPLSIGSVHAYVLTADGKALDSLHVGEAKPERVIAMLERAIQTLKVPEGQPVVKPVPLSRAPETAADALVLHLTARYLLPRQQPGARKDIDDDYVPADPQLGTARSGSWGALPSEDWIELKKADWQKLLPAGPVRVDRSWDIDRAVASQLLTRFYPTTENNDLSTNRIDEQVLKATVVSIEGGIVRARIDGSLKMKHAFYPGREDANVVQATVVGYLDFEPGPQRIRTLRLITDKASYGGESRRFGVAVRSVPARAD